MILVIDNYDSFTYNLVQYLGELGAQMEVFRNDRIAMDRIDASQPEKVVISPGPCTPNEAGISVDLIRRFTGRIPMLGVCLGHQCIGQAFGGRVVRAPAILHGKVSEIHHDGRSIFRGLSQPFIATRYHSLIVERESLPDCLEVSAQTHDGIIMGLRHREHPVEGVQFHPESILTAEGKVLLKNFLDG
jgi:anthranilate synthase/aminodeoxychorismate synthase-like glutamine amidotransferase